nr:MBL fold metallo-hydrolase [Tessaracoccus coleopterorum]
MLGCLSDLGVREVPMFVLTHYHADHTGGAPALIDRFSPSLVLVRGGDPPRWLADAVRRVGGELRSAVEGEEVAAGEARWVTVSAPQPQNRATELTDAEGSPENDASVVGIAEVGGVRVMLAGDAEPSGQARALRSARRLGLDLSVAVLKLPHHGSARQEERFFRACGASLAVASAGQDNGYGHPAQAALDLATGLGMAVARTDRQGAVAVARTDDGLTVTTERR